MTKRLVLLFVLLLFFLSLTGCGETSAADNSTKVAMVDQTRADDVNVLGTESPMNKVCPKNWDKYFCVMGGDGKTNGEVLGHFMEGDYAKFSRVNHINAGPDERSLQGWYIVEEKSEKEQKEFREAMKKNGAA